MDEMVKKRNERLAQTVIKGLQSRNMSGYYAADKEEALKIYKEAKKKYLEDMSDENWAEFCIAKRICMMLGVRI